MSQMIASPTDCCRPCPEPINTSIPGPQGAAGAAGTNGTNGNNAYTTLTAPFTMPDEGLTVLAAVGVSSWAAVGQKVFVGDPGAAASGTFQVVTVPDSTHILLQNIENTAASAYTENSAPGTVFPAASAVSPSGLQGPPGANGTSGAPTTATYITQTPNGTLSNEQALSALATGLMKVTTGTGVVSSVPQGVGAGEVAPNDGALTAGQLLKATASGIATDTAANNRTALGLGTMATQDAGAVAITGGTAAGLAITTSSVSATTLVASGATTLSDNLTLAKKLFYPPSALQTVGAANLVQANAAKIRVAGSGAGVVLTSTPTVSLGTADGQEVLIQGTDDTNSVQFQDDGSLAGSKLRLGAANRTLGKGDSLRLSWDATDGFWYEVGFTVLV